MKEAKEGKRVVLFVDAAHFVHKAYLGFIWCFERIFIKAPSDAETDPEGQLPDSGDGDEMLPHIKKAKALPKLVEALKGTVESIRQHSALVSRVEPDHINDLENCVVALKNLSENRGVTE